MCVTRLTIRSGFNNDDSWGHRAGEPNKAVICSLALARLRTDIRGGSSDLANSNAVGMAQKLLLFWRKPARRCWWEGIELDSVEGVEGGRVKVWIRRVWTLEMVSLVFFSWRCIWILDRALGSRRFDGAGGLAVDGILLTVGIERYRTALDVDVVVVAVWAKKAGMD